MSDATGVAPEQMENLILLREVEAFLFHELALLDDRQFEEWIELFTDDGYYWAPASPDQENPLDNVSLFYDDVEMLTTRFNRLRHPRVHSQIPPSRTSHMVSNVVITARDQGDETLAVSARFQMLEFRPGQAQRTFGGKYDYKLLCSAAGDFRIAMKKATIINCDDVHLPIAIPF
jgi:3-phenylpropionate/cinnamic acid dioxygenase small subunit